MSMLSKMKKKTEEKRVGNNHPILSMGVSRNLRDAYLDEIVFASFADDEQIDESEQAYLAKVRLALGIPNGEVEETINAFAAADSDGKIARAMESAKTLAGSGLANILLCEFSLVWTSHGQDLTELDECRRQVAEWMDVKGFNYDEKFFAVFDEVSAKVKDDPTAVYALYDYLDDDVIRYLFADIFEIEKIFAEKRDAENRAVLPHPLKTVLDDAQKACYLSTVRRTVNETSDNAPTKIQQKGLRHLAVALGVKDAGEATEEKEITLSTDSAMRSLAFFRYCDMARLFAMDGRPSFSAAQNLALEEVATAFKLVPEDIAFLKEYSAYLGNGKEPDAAHVIHKHQSPIRFPEGVIRYFTPYMKPIVLAGGDAPVGVYQIVDGHYRLEHTLNVGAQTRLVIKNAVVDFAPDAEFKLLGCATEISDSVFNGEKTDDKELIGTAFFNGDSNCSTKMNVKFEKCHFNGSGCRGGIGIFEGTMVVESCQFDMLVGSLIGWNQRNPASLFCNKSRWVDCSNVSFAAGKVTIANCDFVNCVSTVFIHCCLEFDADVSGCLFENSSCSQLQDYDRVTSSNPHYEHNCTINSNGFTAFRNEVSLDQLRAVRAENK